MKRNPTKIINLIPDKGLDSFGRTVTYPEVSRDFLQCPHRQMPKIASIRHKTNPLPSQFRQIHQSSYHSTLDSLSYLQRRQTNKQKAQLTPVGTKANKFQRFFTSLTKLFGSISQEKQFCFPSKGHFLVIPATSHTKSWPSFRHPLFSHLFYHRKK